MWSLATFGSMKSLIGLLILCWCHNGDVVCDENNGKDNSHLSYRLVMFDPSTLTDSSNDVKEVREHVDDIQEYEEEEAPADKANEEADEEKDAESGSHDDDGDDIEAEEQVEDEEQEEEDQEDEDQEEDRPKQTSENNIQPTVVSKPSFKTFNISSLGMQSPPLIYNGVTDPRYNVPLYYGGSATNTQPNSYEIQDLQREISKIQASKKVPNIIEKPSKSKVRDMAREIMNSVDKEQKRYSKKNKRKKSKKKKSSKRASKSKKKRRGKKSVLESRDNASIMPVNNPNLREAYASGIMSINPNLQQEEHARKGISPRDINLRITSKNPLPVFIRHYRTTWPYPQVYPPTRNANYMHPQDHQEKQGTCKKNCQKKRQNPKVQTDVVYHKKVLSNTVACQDEYPRGQHVQALSPSNVQNHQPSEYSQTGYYPPTQKSLPLYQGYYPQVPPMNVQPGIPFEHGYTNTEQVAAQHQKEIDRDMIEDGVEDDVDEEQEESKHYETAAVLPLINDTSPIKIMSSNDH